MYSDRCSVCINLAAAASVDPALDGSGHRRRKNAERKNTSRERERERERESGRGTRKLVGPREGEKPPKEARFAVYLCFITGRMRYFAERHRPRTYTSALRAATLSRRRPFRRGVKYLMARRHS